MAENKKKWHQTEPCIYNEWVKCRNPGKCQSCGWHPEVAQGRKERMKERMGQCSKS